VIFLTIEDTKMQVTFNTNFDAQGFTVEAQIKVENVALSDLDFEEIRRWFNDISDNFSINSDGRNHVFFVDFRYSATVYDINEAITLLDEFITELA
jgi:hypothetical protein